MARIRSVKPEFWTDRPFVRRVPARDARMLYMALWNLADEHGRLGGDSYYIKSQVFPYAEDDDLTPDAISGLLDMLAAAGKIVRYEVDGDPYLYLPKLGKHQRLEPHKVPSRLPDVPEPSEPPPTPPAQPVVENVQVSVPAQIRADESARDLDGSEPDADSSALLYVACSRLPVAGSREHGPPRANVSQPPLLAVVESLPFASLTEPPSSFDDFWTHWPRKTGKPSATKAFANAVRKKRADPAAIVEACRAYAGRCQQVGQNPMFIPYPATWLNDERWNDDLDAVMPLPASCASPAPPRESATGRAVAEVRDSFDQLRKLAYGDSA